MVLNEAGPEWQMLLAQRDRLIGRKLTISNGWRRETVTIKDVRDAGDKLVFTVEVCVRRGRGTGTAEYDIVVDKTTASLPKFTVSAIEFTFQQGEARIDC